MLVREIPQWESTDKGDIYEWQTGNAQFKKSQLFMCGEQCLTDAKQG